jgi:hypothetical protein
LEEAAELYTTVSGIDISWDEALASFNKAVSDARKKGYNVQVEMSQTSEAKHLFALISTAETKPETKEYGCDYDGLYFAFGRFIQELVETHNQTGFGLNIERTGASG